MAEVLVQFDEPQRAADGRYFVPQVWGRRTEDGIWEAWIEFHPAEGGEPVRTARETEQLTRGDLRYWAAGLTRVYLQDALDRALSPQVAYGNHPIVTVPALEPHRDAEHIVLETNVLTHSAPVLDPFVLYRQNGEYLLRQELRGLHAQHLRDIIAAFDIPDMDTIDFTRTFEDALAERIVAGVQQRVGPARDGVVTNPTRSKVP